MREVITKETCRSCGACCTLQHDQDVYVDMTSKDVAKLSKKFVRLHVVYDFLSRDRFFIRAKWKTQKTGPLKDFSFCRCVALRGSVMHKVSCSIYKNRPEACRDAVRPGDRACREIRREMRHQIEDLETSPT